MFLVFCRCFFDVSYGEHHDRSFARLKPQTILLHGLEYRWRWVRDCLWVWYSSQRFRREGQFELILTFESRHVDNRAFGKPRDRLSQNRETGCWSVDDGRSRLRKPNHDRLPRLAVRSEYGLRLVVCFGQGGFQLWAIFPDDQRVD